MRGHRIAPDSKHDWRTSEPASLQSRGCGDGSSRSSKPLSSAFVIQRINRESRGFSLSLLKYAWSVRPCRTRFFFSGRPVPKGLAGPKIARYTFRLTTPRLSERGVIFLCFAKISLGRQHHDKGHIQRLLLSTDGVVFLVVAPVHYIYLRKSGYFLG